MKVDFKDNRQIEKSMRSGVSSYLPASSVKPSNIGGGNKNQELKS